MPRQYKRGGALPQQQQRLINTYYMFPDLTEFITSDFYANTINQITKYPPVKKVFNATPPYKQYRIVVRSMGETYHTVYAIDCKDEDDYEDACHELETLGAVNQNVYGTQKHDEAMQNMDKRIKDNQTTYNYGYNAGVENRPSESESAWDGFKEGFSSVVGLAKDLF